MSYGTTQCHLPPTEVRIPPLQSTERLHDWIEANKRRRSTMSLGVVSQSVIRIIIVVVDACDGLPSRTQLLGFCVHFLSFFRLCVVR